MSVSVRKLFSAGLVSLGVLIAALLFSSAPALAATAPAIEAQWVTKVSATSATLEAKVNPGEAATSYRFEYATSETVLLEGHGEVLPAPPAPEGEAGAGEVGVVVEEHPQNLQPRTNYYYRVTATNGDGETPGCQAEGTCPSFTTQTAGDELVLPDGRAWELVSPPPGSNGDAISVQPFNSLGGVIQAARDGGAITYMSFTASEPEPAGLSNFSQILSVHGEDGWSSRDIATPHQVAAGFYSDDGGQEYRFFSADLSVGLVEPLGSGALGEESADAALLSPGASEKTIYLRANAPLSPETAEQGVYGQAEAEGGYRPLVTGCPAEPAECGPRVKEDANVPLGTVFGQSNEEHHVSSNLHFEGATSDLSHVVFRSRVPLAAETPEGKAITEPALYEWSGGRLQIVSVLPHGEPADRFSDLGSRGTPYNVRGAISNDGSRIVWSDGEHLYMRDMSTEQTVQLDAFQEGGSGNSFDAYFQFAYSDGSKVFFTDEAKLIGGSTAHREYPDLYECEMVKDVAGELSCKLTDLTVDPGGHADVGGMVAVGSNEDTNLYFVADGVLTSMPNARHETAAQGDCSENANAGQTCNLYLLHYNGTSWTTTFIASLSGGDRNDWGGREAYFGDLAATTSGVSPNGEYLAFMSERPLIGYDNRDASSGEPDEEVYLYQAPSAAAPSGRLVCASCNPTGERPVGVHDTPELAVALGHTPLIDSQENWIKEEKWLAGSIPGWTPYEAGVAPYQSRYLSDSGRLFFDSPDDLVPQATNGLSDVYEYEPAGVGGEDGCETTSSTFSERSDGCVALISSDSSGEESTFVDASGRGPGGQEAEDVFFESSAQLVAADKGSSLAMYDAHLCSAASPCSPEAVSVPPCTTADACRAAPTPQPQVFGAPSSATFAGAGNLTSPPPVVVKPKAKPVKCKRAYVKKHNRCVKKKRAKKSAKQASRGRRGDR